MATSSSTTSNHSTDPTTVVPSLSNLPFTISVKLNPSNYPVWKAQALPYFRGAIIKIPNPHYLQWLRQDSLSLATINVLLTKDVLTEVMSYTTSREVWLALERTFSSISRAKSLHVTASINIATKQPQQQNQSIFHTAANFQQSNRGRDGYRGRRRGCRFTSHDQGPSNSDQQIPKNQPQAMVVAHYQHTDNEWHPDIGATHHLTNDVNNIHLQNEDYGSQVHIQVANGIGLKIVQSGTPTLSSPSKSFKNLLSVQHFFLDNNVFFEFHIYFFLVKDYNGLYNFLASLAHLQPQALSSVRVSTNIWHRRLSHAFLLILNKVILLPIQNKNTSICSECQLAKSHDMPFKNVHVSVLKPLVLIYSDVWGSAPNATLPQHEDRSTPPLLPSPSHPQHQNIHSMITKSKNNIHKPK
ncbi:hypothetical protein AAG906_038474 [Vitis piasezkii]